MNRKNLHQIIYNAAKEQETTLDLSGMQLSKLPVEICQLSNLTHLYLRNNQLIELPGEIDQLSKLTVLSLRSNKLSKLPIEICQLSSLTQLYLRDNTLSELPAEIGQLTNLTILGLSNNRLSELPAEIGQLSKLTTFDLSNNRLSELPAEIGQLSKLTTFDLSNNQLRELPAWIVGLGLRIGHSQYMYDSGINLYNNPLITPPVEIVQKGIEAVQGYFASIKDKETVKLNEVKVLFVGEGMAGKTSLLKSLRGQQFNPDESQTHGINVVSFRADKIEGLGKNDDLRNFWLNCWDFGGQEVMHASHRFFMSERSLYILIIDSRTDSKKYHWLKHIQKYGGDSPLIVVMNKIDANPNYNIEQKDINDSFPHIKNRFHRISCKSGEGLPELIECIAKTIPETSLFGTNISADWMRIKNKLISETKKNQYIDRERFTAICEENNVHDKSQQKTLLQYLHDIGIVLYFEKLDLADIYVLDPHWVTIGVYKIINSAKIEKGILNVNDLDYILNEEEVRSDEYDPAKQKAINYSSREQHYIINIMMQFDLCYQYDKCNGLYIVPDQLPKELESEPLFLGDTPLKFIMQYDYLPSSIISRLMIRLKNDIPAFQQWKYGMFLKNSSFDCQAKVKVDEEIKTIAIAVHGEKLRKREYFSIIRHNILDISHEFENLKIDEFIPLPGYEDRLVGYRELLGYNKAGRNQ
jgi:internalin A